MGALSFVCGSAAGAVLAWFAGRREPSRSLVAAYTGLSCALLGMLMGSSRGAMTPMIQATFGLLGAATPLTLCARFDDETGAYTVTTVRRLAVTLTLALACGIGCAAMGFAFVYGIRYPPHTIDVGEAASHVVVSR